MIAGAIIVLAGWVRQRQISKNPTALPHASELSPEARQLLRPFANFEEDLRKLLVKHESNPAAKVIANEARAEAAQLQAAAFRLIQSREELRKLNKPASEARLKLSQLEEEARSRELTPALAAAIESHRDQVSEFDRVLAQITPIDDRIREAHAALSALKSRISVSSADMLAHEVTQEGLQAMVDDMRALEKSFDETEALLKERQQL